MTTHPDLFEAMVKHVMAELGDISGIGIDEDGDLCALVINFGEMDNHKIDRATVQRALDKWDGGEK